MKLLFSLAAIAALGHAAIAQGRECKAIADPNARLACYDKSAPPSDPVAAPSPASRLAPESKTEASTYVDRIGAEDELLHAKMNGICRGC
jgi:hypothetical protein